MLGDELRHFKHVDLSLTAEQRFELSICIDVALILLILKIVLLDVFPWLVDRL